MLVRFVRSQLTVHEDVKGVTNGKDPNVPGRKHVPNGLTAEPFLRSTLSVLGSKSSAGKNNFILAEHPIGADVLWEVGQHKEGADGDGE